MKKILIHQEGCLRSYVVTTPNLPWGVLIKVVGLCGVFKVTTNIGHFSDSNLEEIKKVSKELEKEFNTKEEI